MNLAHTGARNSSVTTLQGVDRGQKLRLAESAGTTEVSVPASLHQLRHAANVIVVPMCCDNQCNLLGRIKTEAFEVL